MANRHVRFAAVSLVYMVYMVCGLALGACAPVELTENRPLVAPPSAFLHNANLRIEAPDGSFSIEGGSQFTPPFYTNLLPRECPEAAGFADETILDSYTAALDCGAREVLVIVDGDRPLHGVLALGRIPRSAKGPTKRSYLLRIPPEKLRSAADGLTTVSYELYDWERRWDDGSRLAGQWKAWILWLSNTPLR